MDPLRHDRTPSPHQAPSDPAPPDTAVFQAQAASATTSREPQNRAPARDAPLPPSGLRHSGTGVTGNFGWGSRRRQEERALPPQAPDYAPFRPGGREPEMVPRAETRPFDTGSRRRGPERGEPRRGGQTQWEPPPATDSSTLEGRSRTRRGRPATGRPGRTRATHTRRGRSRGSASTTLQTPSRSPMICDLPPKAVQRNEPISPIVRLAASSPEGSRPSERRVPILKMNGSLPWRRSAIAGGRPGVPRLATPAR